MTLYFWPCVLFLFFSSSSFSFITFADLFQLHFSTRLWPWWLLNCCVWQLYNIGKTAFTPLQLTASLTHKKIILHNSQAVQLQMHLSQQQNSAPIFPREALADERKVHNSIAAVSIGRTLSTPGRWRTLWTAVLLCLRVIRFYQFLQSR